MFSLAGKSAVVTGGASGIGRAIVRRFAAAGARVLVADRRAPEDDVAYQPADVAREEDVAGALAAARERFGRVDILVNNAGIQPLGVGFEQLTGALLERTLAVNVAGVAFGIKHAGRALPAGGRVINTASFVGLLATPGAAAYAASKAAVIHLTRLGAVELAPRRITVNAVSPGTIRTPAVTAIPDNPEIPFMERRTPLGRLGEPDEVAALCHFLASDEAAYITGQNIAIDGGLTAGWTEYDLAAPANVREGRWVDDP
ncbi:MAG TPA: SDR family oxidoreductase [Opitutaceae bacterium]|nr:SDR family oxidoreductase [Opitutaceae bacterium]